MRDPFPFARSTPTSGCSTQVTFVTSQTMASRIQNRCRDPSVVVLGLEDGLVPESDDFMLGKVREDVKPQTTTGDRLRQTSCAGPQGMVGALSLVGVCKRALQWNLALLFRTAPVHARQDQDHQSSYALRAPGALITVFHVACV